MVRREEEKGWRGERKRMGGKDLRCGEGGEERRCGKMRGGVGR